MNYSISNESVSFLKNSINLKNVKEFLQTPLNFSNKKKQTKLYANPCFSKTTLKNNKKIPQFKNPNFSQNIEELTDSIAFQKTSIIIEDSYSQKNNVFSMYTPREYIANTGTSGSNKLEINALNLQNINKTQTRFVVDRFFFYLLFLMQKLNKPYYEKNL